MQEFIDFEIAEKEREEENDEDRAEENEEINPDESDLYDNLF